jgi:hypothetical protein
MMIILDVSTALISDDDPYQWNIRALRAACTELSPCFLEDRGPRTTSQALFASVESVLIDRGREPPINDYYDGGLNEFPPPFAVSHVEPFATFRGPWHPVSYVRFLWLSFFQANQASPDPDFLPKLVHRAGQLLLNTQFGRASFVDLA